MKRNIHFTATVALVAGITATLPLTAQSTATLHADFSAPQTHISQNLFGIFYEDINYAADGGLYGELIQNRSFEFTKNPTEGWTDGINIAGKSSKSRLKIVKTGGLHQNNPTFVQFTAKKAGDGFANSGYKGIALEAGKVYPGSVWLKSPDGSVTSVTVTLGDAADSAQCATAVISGISSEWKKYDFTLTAPQSTENGRIALYTDTAGTICADFISLFAADIYKNEPNGLRKDLAQMLEEMHPAFVRFPGGCIVHGRMLADRYQWKNTIGPIETRKVTENFWGYYQSYGIGFYEYFRLCEDIGAEPIPVMSVGMSHYGEKSPVTDYQWYAQDVLDMIEWATGPADSTWGKIRAEAGHPEPFSLHYIGIGNEDCGGDYLDRYKYIASAVNEKYPQIKLIISSGFTFNDINFHTAWKQVKAWEQEKATENLVALVDEHYYNPYSWFLTNGDRYDNAEFYPRGKDKPKVFIGEYASWVEGRRNNLFAALTEAAYMTSIERNGDVVEIASYAPLFARKGHVQWQPDAIWFDAKTAYGTPNYYVQSLFMQHKADYTVQASLTQPQAGDTKKKGIEGTIGIGSWATTAQFKNITVTNGESGAVIYSSRGAKELSAFKKATQSGSWKVKKGVFTQSSAATPAFMALDNEEAVAGLQKYTFELEAKKTGGAEGFLIGFGVKGANLYWWNLGGWGNTQSCVEKGTLEARSTIGDAKTLKLESNNWYRIKIVVDGERYQCYLDGELMHEYTDVQNFEPLYAHVGRTEDGKIIVKLVNISEKEEPVQISLDNAPQLKAEAQAFILTGNPADENSFEAPANIVPQTETVTGISAQFTYTARPSSLTILELEAR